MVVTGQPYLLRQPKESLKAKYGLECCFFSEVKSVSESEPFAIGPVQFS